MEQHTNRIAQIGSKCLMFIKFQRSSDLGNGLNWDHLVFLTLN